MLKEQIQRLEYKPKTVYSHYADIESISDKYCIDYKTFLDESKTERSAVKYTIAMAEKNGFEPFDSSKKYKAGNKVYYNNRNKGLFLIIIGEDAAAGANIIASHIDSPRIDLKPRPLYEDSGIGYFKTHYYGGIKKYQWSAIPLALHGVVIKKNGDVVDICYGENENEPVLCISDLMPHIGREQYERKLGDGILGEELNIIVGVKPLENDEDESVRLNILSLLNEKYGIVEEELLTAELTAVPATKARDAGLDGSMILAYGQDDKVCSYPSLTSLFEIKEALQKTAICILADKEEIGSFGVTGLGSDTLKNLLMDLCESRGVSYTEFIRNSICLSADVGGAYDPTFSSAYDSKNSAYLAKGIVITKYTGARGKSGSSDASAELFSLIAKEFDKAGVVWQTGEYGKVDQGGAGTVAKEIAALDIDVIDAGVPVLSMHSPAELAAKVDIYMMHKASFAFYNIKNN